MAESLDCVATDELIPELAIGVAPGDDRARALGHLALCPRCRTELESVTATADALLLLAPEREPPPGFESRVLAGAATPRRRTGLLLRAAAVVVAVVVAAALGGGTVWSRTAEDRQLAESYRDTLRVAQGRYFRAVPIMADGAIPIGNLWAYQGKPSWLLVVVQTENGSGRYTVRMTTRDGRRSVLGSMSVQQGTGTWSTTISVPVGEILAVHLTDRHGLDITATF